MPSQIIRVDLLEKINELRDTAGWLPREKVISGMRRAHKVGRHLLTAAGSILLKNKNEKQTKEYKTLLSVSFFARPQ